MLIFKKILKWTGIILGSIVVALLAMYAYIAHDITSRMEKKYSFSRERLIIPADSASIVRGKHLVAIKGCTDCHGARLDGKTMMDDHAVGRLSAANLTMGKGGLPADFSDDDWVTALRHGIDRGGRPLLFMPSHESTLLTENDMSDIIAYCRQVAPVDHQLPVNDIGPVARVMSYLGKMPLLSVEKIDHHKPMVEKVDTTESIAHGQYLVVSCSGCHRPDMRGGAPVAPGFPPVPNITSGGEPGRWTEAQFLRALHTGQTPSGHQLNPDYMPWKMTAQYSDVELKSIFKYLQSLK